MSLKQHTASSQHYISDFKPHSLTHSSSSDPTDGHHARSVHPTESQPTKADHSDLISTSTPPVSALYHAWLFISGIQHPGPMCLPVLERALATGPVAWMSPDLTLRFATSVLSIERP